MADYIVICQHVVGNPKQGYGIHYGWDGNAFPSRKQAISHGFKLRESDDFNIGVIKNGSVVSFDWMHEPVEIDETELDEINRQIFGDGNG